MGTEAPQIVTVHIHDPGRLSAEHFEHPHVATSMTGLAYAMKDLPVGTAYAVWVGIGAVLTVVYAMATGEELISVLKIVFLLMIIGGVLGLKLSH